MTTTPPPPDAIGSSSQRRVLIGVAAAIVLAVVALLVVTVLDGDGEGALSSGDTSTSTADDGAPDPSTTSPSTTAPAATSTSVASSSTVPSSTLPVVVRGYLLGAFVEGAWVSLTDWEAGDLPDPGVSGGEPYRFHDADGNVVDRALPDVGEGCYLGNNHGIDVAFEDPLFDTVGIQASLDGQPRPVSVEPAAPAHVAAVQAWLDSQGEGGQPVEIDRVTRVDLQGDGRDEVFIEASRNTDDFAPDDGGYSVLLHRWVDDQDMVHDDVIAGDVVPPDAPEDEFAIVFTHRIVAIVDANGDGRFELAVRHGYYEGESVELRTTDSALLPVVLETGCGA